MTYYKSQPTSKYSVYVVDPLAVCVCLQSVREGSGL